MTLSIVGLAAAKDVALDLGKKGAVRLVGDFYKQYVQPKFEKIGAQKAVLEGLKKYTRRLERATRFVPTIAIQDGRFELDDVYEPATLVRWEDKKEFQCSSFLRVNISNENCLLVIDAAGMGKSTFSKYLIRRSIESLVYFPVLIELRRLKKDEELFTFIASEMLESDATAACKLKLHEGFASGGFLFVFDGYDELSDEMRGTVNAEIDKFCIRYPICRFLLTSRPDPGLVGFSTFSRYGIKSLTRDQAFDLLRRYDKGRGTAEPLIEKVKLQPQVTELLGNPLLVTLLYKAYDYRPTIPAKRNAFFRQVYEALFQDHDLSKVGAFERRKKSMLDMDDFHAVVRALAMVTLKTGRIQYSSEEFAGLLSRAAKHAAPISFDVAKMRSDLLSAVPLFVREGTDVRWSHKSFQDYFSAQFIRYNMKDKQAAMIDYLSKDDNFQRYEGVLSLFAELDVGVFRSACLFPIVDNFFNEMKKHSPNDAIDDYEFRSRLMEDVTDTFIVAAPPGVLEDGVQVFSSLHEAILEKYDRARLFTVAQSHRVDDLYVVVLFKNMWARLRSISYIDPDLFDLDYMVDPVPTDVELNALKRMALSGPSSMAEFFYDQQSDEEYYDTLCALNIFVARLTGSSLPVLSRVLDAKHQLEKLESTSRFDDLLN